MRTHFDPNLVSWLNYYQSQANQSGHGYFRGVPYQRGGSLGGLFKGLFRMIMPMAKTAGKAIGKEALHAGLNLAGDALGGQNIKQATKRRARKAGRRLVKKAKLTLNQTGKGIKRRKRKAKPKRKGTKKRKATVKKRKKLPRDIFA